MYITQILTNTTDKKHDDMRVLVEHANRKL